MDTSEELLEQGIAAYKAGHKEEAQRLFWEVLKQDPSSEQAWLWLSGTVGTDEERRACLERALDINPANEMAQRGLRHLEARAPRAAPDVEPSAVATPAGEGLAAGGAAPAPRARSSAVFWLLVAGLVVILLVASAVLAYQVLGAQPTDPPDEITSVIFENLAAHNAEDIERYMATIHSRFPGYEQLRQSLAQTFETYDLESQLSDVRVVEATRNRARVSFVLVIRGMGGPEYRDNRIEGVYLLRKEDGRWKLYDQETIEQEYLE